MSARKQHQQKLEGQVVIILAAGKSSRMGYPKFLLPFNSRMNFTEAIIDAYRAAGLSEILLVVNKDHQTLFNAEILMLTSKCRIVVNPFPDLDRLHSIKIGLKEVKEKKIFIQPVDQPFVDSGLIQKMLESAPEHGYVAPRVCGRGAHPVLICGSAIKKILKSSVNQTLRQVLIGEPIVEINHNDESLLNNINTPEDYLNLFPSNFKLFNALTATHV